MSKMSLANYLRSQGLTDDELMEIVKFRKQYETPELNNHARLPVPKTLYVGGETLKLCIRAILAGYHLILEGEKGVGKNTLVETLAFIFKRPLYEFPFNGHTDVSQILGEDTLSIDNGRTVVKFKEHSLLQAMKNPVGAWFVGDEVNMARSEVLSVLHAVTDYRRKLDVPGYGVVHAHPAFRFIGTMNYGYMGTQELNEAFADRFVIVHVPPSKDEDMINNLIVYEQYLNPTIARRLVKLYTDLSLKAKSGSITSRAVTIRGLYQTIDLVKQGCEPKTALRCCVVNKAFDEFERTQIEDTVNTLFSEEDVWLIKKEEKEE
jgi:MoxR-like ATPase